MRRLDLVGQTFGRLTVVEMVGLDKWKNSLHRCLCTCGNEIPAVRGTCLRSGSTKSCGCFSSEIHAAQLAANNNQFRHGHGAPGKISPEYHSWLSMKNRCTNPNYRGAGWSHYGSAGVKVCEGLREFIHFLVVLGERPEGTSLGRFLDSGNYSCGVCAECDANGWLRNCEWQTKAQQAAEKSAKVAQTAWHERRAVNDCTVRAWKYRLLKIEEPVEQSVAA